MESTTDQSIDTLRDDMTKAAADLDLGIYTLVAQQEIAQRFAHSCIRAWATLASQDREVKIQNHMCYNLEAALGVDSTCSPTRLVRCINEYHAILLPPGYEAYTYYENGYASPLVALRCKEDS